MATFDEYVTIAEQVYARAADGAPDIGGKVDQERIAARALLGVPLFDLVEDAGYHTRIVQGPVVHAPLGGADEVTSAGSATNFELHTLQRTPLAAPAEALGIGMDQARAQVTGALERFADPPDSPAFTLTHVMAPHAPFSFEADGSAPARSRASAVSRSSHCAAHSRAVAPSGCRALTSADPLRISVRTRVRS